MKKEMLNLNKRTITPPNNVEIAALRGRFNGGIISEKSPGEGYIKGPDGKWYEWVMGAMSLVAGAVPVGGYIGGALCLLIGNNPLSEHGFASSICGS